MIPQVTDKTNVYFSGEGFAALPATRVIIDGADCMMTVWKPTEEELIEIAGGGCIAMIVLGTAHPPVILTTQKMVEID
jgi:hypothetical protein